MVSYAHEEAYASRSYFGDTGDRASCELVDERQWLIGRHVDSTPVATEMEL